MNSRLKFGYYVVFVFSFEEEKNFMISQKIISTIIEKPCQIIWKAGVTHCNHFYYMDFRVASTVIKFSPCATYLKKNTYIFYTYRL